MHSATNGWGIMFRFLRHSYRRLSVCGLIAASLLLMVGATGSAQEGGTVEDETGTDNDPVVAAAEQVATQTGLSFEEAHAALLRQSTVGEFQLALEEHGPPSFGGLFIEYAPQYRIVLLASEKKGEQVRQAASDLPFDELDPFVTVRETPFTEDVLERERDRVRKFGDGLLTTTDVDLAVGEIRVTVATADDESTLRARLENAHPRIQARRIVIWQGVSEQEDSLGGLGTWINGSSPCTTGYSVKRISDGAEGVATAGHCENGNRYIAHHPDVILNHIAGQDSGSLDVEWHKTPGIDDLKRIKWHENGSRTDVTGQKSRSNMSVGSYVCVYGAASNNYQCGQIKGKSYQPTTGNHNDTFIRVDSVVDTRVGDSGAPWFLGGVAYGIHTGTTPCGFHSGEPCYPYFMAQNYMEQLGIRVQITAN